MSNLDAELDRLFGPEDGTTKHSAAVARLREAVKTFVQEERDALPDQSHEAIRELAGALQVSLSHMVDAITAERSDPSTPGSPVAALRDTVTELVAAVRQQQADLARLAGLIEAPRVREVVRDERGRAVGVTERIAK